MADAYLQYYEAFHRWLAARNFAPSNEEDFVHPDDWATEYVQKLEFAERNEELWQILGHLIGRAPTVDALAFVAAGPLENLMIGSGNRFVAELRDLAFSDVRWEFALRCTYTTRMPESVVRLVDELNARDPEGAAAQRVRAALERSSDI